MTAQLLLTQAQITADKQRWLNARRHGITASEIASILGIAPAEYGSAWALYAAKTTGEHFGGDTDATLRGTHLEPYVADRFTKEHPSIVLTEGGLYHSSYRKWQMATFDRLAVDTNNTGYDRETLMAKGYNSPWMLSRIVGAPMFPVQIKTSATYEGWGDAGTADMPVYYRAQALHEMDVADADEIQVPCLFVSTWQLRVYRIVRDNDVDADIHYMREAAEEFLDRVQRQDAPPVDWTPATTKALRTIRTGDPNGTAVIPFSLARRYRKARIAKQRAERELGQVVNEMLLMAGDAKYLVTGDRMKNPADRDAKVATRLRFPRRDTDTKMLKQRYPQIAKEVERETTVDSIAPGTWAKSHIERKTIQP